MHEDSSVSKAYASLSLPATPYELRDAIERAHLDDGAEPYIEIMDHTGFPFLEPYLEDGNDLYALNALAEKLATLEDVVSTATHFVLRKYKDNNVIYGAVPVDERGTEF